MTTAGTSARNGLAALAAGTAAVAVHDLVQRKHSVLRNYPVVGHLRYLMEDLRPELQQYFIERNFDGTPFDRDTRSVIYSRAKGEDIGAAFGTERQIRTPGHTYLVPSIAPVEPPEVEPRVRLGGPDCSKPYDISLLNVSAMSFGALSANAIRALNKGARLGGFAHDTGEGGLSQYHQEHGGDLIWELGSGYFSSRTKDGRLDRETFREKASLDQVKAVELKLSQGAKPGVGGMLPAPKVNEEIAQVRGVEPYKTCISPSAHKEFSTPTGLIELIAEMRELSGGKPSGFKLCVGSRREVLAICKAIHEVGTAPDFIVVDGAEGGTGAAPQEFEDHVGAPLREGLILLHNALVGSGLRDRIRIGASGKIAQGNDLVRSLVLGADYTNAARPMMMSIGCIQAQNCHTGKCPVGVATQSARRQRALDVDDKAERARRYHAATIAEALHLMAAMGAASPAELDRTMLREIVSPSESSTVDELYTWLEPGELLDGPRGSWATDWNAASADSFH